MDRDQVMQWAREASVGDGSELSGDAVDAFAALVWNAAMERAADECSSQVLRDAEYGGRFGGYGKFMGDKTGIECAAAIRALKQPTEASNG